MRQITEFLQRLWSIGRRRPRDLRHVFGVANATAAAIEDPEADVRDFTHTTIEEIAPGARFTFQIYHGAQASITLLEGGVLAALMVRVQARRVFEFGTYKGVSTAQLALNLPGEGRVFTLDLPEELESGILRVDKPVERQIAAESGKGALVPEDLRSRITFLQADSAAFDTTPYRESMDLAFVDGAHSYDYVRNDTVKALELLRPGGAIAWHDCAPNHRDVVRALKDSGLPINLVRGTAVAFAFKPGNPNRCASQNNTTPRHDT
jgi:predicted O-methyltransferase YrrM